MKNTVYLYQSSARKSKGGDRENQNKDSRKPAAQDKMSAWKAQKRLGKQTQPTAAQSTSSRSGDKHDQKNKHRNTRSNNASDNRFVTAVDSNTNVDQDVDSDPVVHDYIGDSISSPAEPERKEEDVQELIKAMYAALAQSQGGVLKVCSCPKFGHQFRLSITVVYSGCLPPLFLIAFILGVVLA